MKISKKILGAIKENYNIDQHIIGATVEYVKFNKRYDKTEYIVYTSANTKNYTFSVNGENYENYNEEELIKILKKL